LMCKKLFSKVRDYCSKHKVHGPIEINPSCHKRAHVDVFLDAKAGTVIISCSVCERRIEEFKIATQTTRKHHGKLDH
jgi:hypothetical protein